LSTKKANAACDILGAILTEQIKNNVRILALLLLDIAAYYTSLLSAYYSRQLAEHIFPQVVALQFSLAYFLRIWWIPTIFLAFLIYDRLYIKRLPFWDETKEILKAISAATIAILVIISLGKMSSQISRLTVIFLWIYSLCFFPLFRLVGKRAFHSLLWRDNVIIIGAGTAGIAAAQGISSDRHLGYHVMGFLDDDENIGSSVAAGDRSYPVWGKVGDFKQVVEQFRITTVIVAIPSLPTEKLSELTNEIQKLTRTVLLVPDIKGVALSNTELYYLFMEQLFLLKINNNLKSTFNRFVKRLFDLTLIIAFLPFLLPAIACIALLIKMDSRGPVFHIQDRFGKDKTIFPCIKFRTMYMRSDEILNDHLSAYPEKALEWQTYKKLKGPDPRVTRIGRFLRQTSLDELPQFFNVLKGDMSLVGSRPYLPREENDMQYHIDTILLTPPGITGLWQVSGRNKLTFDDRLVLDAWYVLNWSLWLDIVILFKTFRVVLAKEGAY
jgi:Undecaprenyl-phosphate galactose phosphotransferase WbaP